MLKSLILYLTPPANLNKVPTIYAEQLCKRYEGLGPKGIVKVGSESRVYPYICPAGKPTLGYGRVISWDLYNQLKVTGITLKQAELNFKEDFFRFAREVAKLVKVTLQDYQFDAIVVLSYNIGLGNLKSSTLLRKLNLKDYVGAGNEFSKWIYANKHKLQGLVNRREAERRMFLNTPPRPVLVEDKVQAILDRKAHMYELMAA